MLAPLRGKLILRGLHTGRCLERTENTLHPVVQAKGTQFGAGLPRLVSPATSLSGDLVLSGLVRVSVLMLGASVLISTVPGPHFPRGRGTTNLATLLPTTGGRSGITKKIPTTKLLGHKVWGKDSWLWCFVFCLFVFMINCPNTNSNGVVQNRTCSNPLILQMRKRRPESSRASASQGAQEVGGHLRCRLLQGMQHDPARGWGWARAMHSSKDTGRLGDSSPTVCHGELPRKPQHRFQIGGSRTVMGK